MNGHGIAAIYRFEMARWKRTLWQSLITPVITTALYFVVFGAALGSRIKRFDNISHAYLLCNKIFIRFLSYFCKIVNYG
jgi:ABC-2 type transport system permease protein